MGIRAETGNYQELSSIFGHFPKIKPHKHGRIENYQEFQCAYIGVTFGVRCKLDIPNCSTKKKQDRGRFCVFAKSLVFDMIFKGENDAKTSSQKK